MNKWLTLTQFMNIPLSKNYSFWRIKEYRVVFTALASPLHFIRVVWHCQTANNQQAKIAYRENQELLAVTTFANENIRHPRLFSSTRLQWKGDRLILLESPRVVTIFMIASFLWMKLPFHAFVSSAGLNYFSYTRYIVIILTFSAVVVSAMLQCYRVSHSRHPW